MHQAQIITIGHELLRGEIVNTNASHIARELRKLGILVSSVLVTPDSAEEASDLIGRMLIERGIVVLTGGLGGTRDDITRHIVARILGRRLVVDCQGEKALADFYRSRGRSFEEADRMQAAVPEGGELLPNSVGLAFGFYVKDGKRHIFSLPGVPGEMKSMFEESVVRRIREEGLEGTSYSYGVLNFIDIGEYTLDRIVREIVAKYPGVDYGTMSSDGLISIRLESLRGGLEEVLQEVESAAPENFIYRGEQRLAETVGNQLRERGCTISAAESCTGGLLSKLLTDVPGSSEYFLGSIVSYSNGVKHKMLGVDAHTLQCSGAVSENTAREMALGCLKRFSSDLSLSITGIAGPGGGSTSKPVGTVYICLAAEDGTLRVEKKKYLGNRDTIRKRSANKALSMLLRHHRENSGKERVRKRSEEG
jgi:nicotinamide-nucleotide amidase